METWCGLHLTLLGLGMKCSMQFLHLQKFLANKKFTSLKSDTTGH